MAHVLLAWEFGANLGHATRLRSLALALRARGHRVSFALRDVVGPQALLGPELGTTFQAPLALHSVARPAWSLADILLAGGYESAHTLGGLAAAWKALLDLTRCDVLLVDYAPTALLAARLAGLPAVHVGHGFSVPPRQSPLPVFRDWTPVADTHAAASDAQVLGSVNAVLARGGVAPLARLCDLFYPERTLLCAWPELDHYAGAGRAAGEYRGPDCEFAPGDAPQWPAAEGPRVFAYLRATHPDSVPLLRALDAAGCVTVCFFPDRAAAADTLPVSPRIRYSDTPVDMQQVLPACALVVCHAGQATVAQAARFGIPCLLLPTQAEQFLLARQLERSSAACNAAGMGRPVDYLALVSEMLRPNGAHAAAARGLAERYRSFDPAALTAEIVEAVEAQLPAAA